MALCRSGGDGKHETFQRGGESVPERRPGQAARRWVGTVADDGSGKNSPAFDEYENFYASKRIINIPLRWVPVLVPRKYHSRFRIWIRSSFQDGGGELLGIVPQL